MASSSNVRRNLLSVHHIPAFWPLCVGAVGGLSAYWVMNFAFPVEEDPTVNALQAQVGSYKTLTENLRTNTCKLSMEPAARKAQSSDLIALNRTWEHVALKMDGLASGSDSTGCRALDRNDDRVQLTWMVSGPGEILGVSIVMQPAPGR